MIQIDKYNLKCNAEEQLNLYKNKNVNKSSLLAGGGAGRRPNRPSDQRALQLIQWRGLRDSPTLSETTRRAEPGRG